MAALLITYSHMGVLFPRYGGLVTGGAIGDGLFFFCSGFTLFMGRQDGFANWYKRRINRIYPTIIMWALLSSLIFGWEWDITDIITTPRYWFIPCIMVYYAIFYFIRKYMFHSLKTASLCAFTVVFVSYFFLLNLNESVMYAAIPYMRIYYFLFMLLGATTAIQTTKQTSPIKAACWAFTGLLIYYICMWIYKIDPFFCKFQIVSLFPLLFAIYWIYRCCNTEAINRILESGLGKAIYFVSSLTLEIYMVQYALFTEKLNNIFPLNIIITYIAIILAAYILKCASRIFSQIFSNEAVNLKNIYQL